MDLKSILNNTNFRTLVTDTVKTLASEHPKAAKIIIYGGLSLIFGSACVYEIMH